MKSGPLLNEQHGQLSAGAAIPGTATLRYVECTVTVVEKAESARGEKNRRAAGYPDVNAVTEHRSAASSADAAGFLAENTEELDLRYRDAGEGRPK